MTILYKLTTQEFTTYNNTKWGNCVTHETSGMGEMCGPGWLHAYTSPELAVLLNPIHANINNPVLWECEGIIQKTDFGLKVGTTKLTTIRRIPRPKKSLFQSVAFGILACKCVYEDPSFHEWANDYLNGHDRTIRAAEGAARAVKWAPTDWAARAARAAVWAARAAEADWAAQSAARAAVWAAWAAAAQKCSLSLDDLAQKALSLKE